MTEQLDVVTEVHDAGAETFAENKGMVDLARTMVLAGIGAAAYAGDETKALMKKLVDRGALAEQKVKKTTVQVARRSETQRADTQGVMERQFESLLARLNIPTRSEFAALSAQINVLSAKIDAAASHDPQAPGPADDTPVI